MLQALLAKSGTVPGIRVPGTVIIARVGWGIGAVMLEHIWNSCSFIYLQNLGLTIVTKKTTNNRTDKNTFFLYIKSIPMTLYMYKFTLLHGQVLFTEISK